MELPQPTFRIDTADVLAIGDAEIPALLRQVYVEGGFTTPEEADLLFTAAAVRERGILIGARDCRTSELAGMVIVVPPDSPARRRAGPNEAELHLLGVKPDYRGHGLGRMLVGAAMARASGAGYSKLILWTQQSMKAAQGLYESTGFVHVGEMERNGRSFKVYEQRLRG